MTSSGKLLGSSRTRLRAAFIDGGLHGSLLYVYRHVQIDTYDNRIGALFSLYRPEYFFYCSKVDGALVVQLPELPAGNEADAALVTRQLHRLGHLGDDMR